MIRGSRAFVGWSMLLLASSAFAATAPELVTEANRLAQADNGSGDALRRAVAFYEQAAQIDTSDATIQVKLGTSAGFCGSPRATGCSR